MLKVVKYLKEHGIEKLKSELGIKVKEYPDLLVLNYDQIESPKSNPIVSECRGLILDREFNVVCRPFDRFFNLGEMPETQAHLNFKKAKLYDKVDGSLIKVYYYDGSWNIATRGTAFAEAEVGAWNITFQYLVLKALNLPNILRFTKLMEGSGADRNLTYLFEVTSRENRVVTNYEGTTLWYLAARHNQTGEYVDEIKLAWLLETPEPKKYKFDSVEHCLEAAKALPNLQEGYVIYQGGIPIAKVKSPAYVVVHHIRGEGLSPKRIMELVLTNEQQEYINYFPEDAIYITPYITSLQRLISEMNDLYSKVKEIENQKDFALKVKDYCYSAVVFAARKSNCTPEHAFYQLRPEGQLKILEAAHNVYNV